MGRAEEQWQDVRVMGKGPCDFISPLGTNCFVIQNGIGLVYRDSARHVQHVHRSLSGTRWCRVSPVRVIKSVSHKCTITF